MIFLATRRENTNRIKAIATDIDGTITDGRRRISTEVISALRRVEEMGIPVMLASGNVLPIAYGLSGFIGTTGPVIAENGGVVFHQKRVRYLGDRKRCDQAFEELAKHMPVKKIFSDRWRKGEVAIEPDVDLAEVKRRVAEFGLKAESTGFAIHIFEPQVSKFNGLKVACEMIDVDVAEVAAFGDSENDVEMIKKCGIGIVPSNAAEEIKKHADFVASSPWGKGFVEGLRWLGFVD
ncbi:MAG: phosphoglycolate phosphatase [Thermoplasmata archaeon]|nr:MAG: phosphoglycolate phosphatase [Thermoplasmata archaeon]